MSTSPAPPASARLSGVQLVGLCTLASRVLGYARDSAMAALFGLGEHLDAFTLAFRIPNLARSLFGEGALTAAFLPAFIAERAEQGDAAARALATAVLYRLTAVLVLVVGVVEIALWLFAASLELSPYHHRLIDLLAIMSPYLVLVCVTAHCSAVLQSQRRFAWPALAPVVLNVCWLGSVGLAARLADDADARIRLIAACLVVGGVLQLGGPALALIRSGWGPSRDWRQSGDRARGVFRSMIPTILGATAAQFNTVLDSLLAWLLAAPVEQGAVAVDPAASAWIESGTGAALYFAQRLYQFPLGLIGVSLGTVLFPVLSGHAARGDAAGLRRDLTHGLCVGLSAGLPASCGLMVLAPAATAALFQHGRFDAADALLTSRIMTIYGAAVWGAISLLLVQRGFYASGDRWTPLAAGLTAVVANLGLTGVLVWLAKGVGLALATTLAQYVHLALAVWWFERRIGRLDWGPLLRCAGKSTAAAVVMTLGCLLLDGALPAATGRFLRLLLLLACGGGLYLGMAEWLRLRELRELLFRGRQRSK
jgi:putative peptidoglycan lipid II flippase